MSPRPPGVVTETAPDPRSLDGAWTPVELRSLPATPFDLHDRRLAVGVVVGDQATAGAVLLAASRGCAVVVRVELPEPEALAFVDDLGRLVDITEDPPGPMLDHDQEALLRLLADGLTITEAAQRLGWSRRSATRRLAAARHRIGSTTTAAALRRFRQLMAGDWARRPD